MKDRLPLVSVLMTTFNRAIYIKDAIESVINSSYQNWELLIVDDYSTDHTDEIVKNYLGDPRIRYIKNDKNLGQFPNRNKAASLAKGKYIKYLDSDDIIYHHGLDVMVKAIEKYPTAGFATQNTKNEDIQPYPYLIPKIEAFEKHFLKFPYLVSGPSGVIFKKEAFDNIKGFNEDSYVGSDTELLLEMACQYDVVVFPPGLIWWRQHEGQAIFAGKQNNEYYLNDYLRIKNIIVNSYVAKNPVTKNRILKKHRNLQLGRIKNLILSGNLELARQLSKQII